MSSSQQVETGPTRDFKGVPKYLVTLVGIFLILWCIAGALFTIETYRFRMIFLALTLLFMLLLYPPSRALARSRVALTIDIVLASLAVISIAYAVSDEYYVYRSTIPNLYDIIFGAIILIVLIEATRRSFGKAFTIIVLFFLAYMYFGYYIPGPLSHKGYDVERIIGHMVMTLDGVYGVPLGVAASYVSLFVIYGALMDAAGAGSFWIDLTTSLMGRKSSSAGRGAVLATALLGGPQGSGVATTMSLTPVLWPTLKEAGYTAEMAAGLISAGGIGAVISPPLMGAAVFLMMEFLDVSYWDIILMVLMPTLLYYVAMFFMVEVEARKHRFRAPEISAPSLGYVLRKKGYHLISLAVLVILVGLGRSPATAALWAILTVIVTSFLSKDRRDWLTPKRLLLAIYDGAKAFVSIAVLLAAAGIITGSFTLTGLGLKVSHLIVELSGGIHILVMILAAISAIIIGLGLPITATYVVCVPIVAPALVHVGIPMHAAHMLIFYYAVLSEVSPPVALSPSAAAAMTGANAYQAMMQAWKYTLPTFLVPFMFSANKVASNLLIVGADLEGFLIATGVSLVSLLLLSLGSVGYVGRDLSRVERLILIAAGSLLAFWILSIEALLIYSLAVAVIFGRAVHGILMRKRMRVT
ncbi:MAG: TRAP transporter fused permease subunit [Candidatus Korarchaeum sp.]